MKCFLSLPVLLTGLCKLALELLQLILKLADCTRLPPYCLAVCISLL